MYTPDVIPQDMAKTYVQTEKTSSDEKSGIEKFACEKLGHTLSGVGLDGLHGCEGAVIVCLTSGRHDCKKV